MLFNIRVRGGYIMIRLLGIIAIAGMLMLTSGCSSRMEEAAVAESVSEDMADTAGIEADMQISENNTESHPESAVYAQFIDGKVSDSDGEFCTYTKDSIEDYDNLVKWAEYDLNGDSSYELIPCLYDGYTIEIYSYANGKIHTTEVEVLGSEGGFFNTKNQYVATDVTHANRSVYLVSEYTGEDKMKIVIYFAKWWQDEENPDSAEYKKYEGENFDSASYEDYTTITADEYEELLAQYTEKNTEIEFLKK